jgi:hypothetical protein
MHGKGALPVLWLRRAFQEQMTFLAANSYYKVCLATTKLSTAQATAAPSSQPSSAKELSMSSSLALLVDLPSPLLSYHPRK